MTVLTKLKTTIIKSSPSVDENQRDELVIDVHPPACKVKHARRSVRKWPNTPGVVFFMFITMFLFSLIGFIAVRQLYDQANHSALRYQGYCSIPVPLDMKNLDSRKKALRWQEVLDAQPREGSDMESMKMMSVGKLDADDADIPTAILNELLDINVDDSLERIAVFQNGHAVSFLHDFESNITGIVDTDRCFLMDMAAESALAPQVFVVGLQQGGEFDVGLVRSRLRALMPPSVIMPTARGMADRCTDKPTYRLQTENGTVIRKRAADEPPHDYVLFAGKNVQQIEISNLPDLLHYEQVRKQHV